MGFSGIGIWELFIILIIVLLLFGTKKLRSIGEDLGSAARGFRNAFRDEEPAGSDEVHTIDHKQEFVNKAEGATQKGPDEVSPNVKPNSDTK